MTQIELNHAVAAATGESLATIRRHGFSVCAMPQSFSPDDDNDDALPNVIDWDALEREQRRSAA